MRNDYPLQIFLHLLPSPALVITCDGVITKANQSVCHLLGYTEDELKHMKLDEIVHQEKYEEYSFSAAEMFASGPESTFELEKRLIKKDKSLLWTHLCLNIAYDTKTYSWYGMVLFTDLTERKRLEEELIKLNQKKEELFANIHQKVKTNLAMATCLTNLPWSIISKDEEPEVLLHSFINRLQSANCIQNTLYKRENTTDIRLRNYLQSLFCAQTTTGNKNNCAVKFFMEDIVLDAATTNALGLIIQEIITHYFRISGTGKTKQKVIVFFNREKSTPHYKLVVKESNNNSEFSDIPEAEDTLLSQRLISTLAEQLGGITHFVPGKWNNQTVEIIFNHFDRFVKSTFYQYNV